MAQTKIEQGLLKFTEATDYLKIPTGTTAQRPSSPVAGYIRFNTTIAAIETYDGTEWVEIGLSPPTFSSVDYPGSATALDPAGGESLVINGTTFNVDITVTIDGTTPSSITRNSENQLTVTAPAKTAGTYNIVFTNTDGGTATAINAVSYNGIPAFTNAAGSLGSVNEGDAINFSVAATEPDGGAITYAVTSGSLPSGATLNTATGAITGTAPSVNADTTSNFTITATDNENQSTARAYSITLTPILPSDSFNTVTYTGTSATHAITGVGFQPDLVWIKDRSNGENHILNDSTRGAGNDLSSNIQNPEVNRPTGFVSFDSDGFTLGTDGGGVVNDSTRGPYVAWCWKANGGTTTSGTGTGGVSSVTHQLNSNAGFCITKFTVPNTGVGCTTTHGLDSTPDFIIMKRITAIEQAWWVWHNSFTSGNDFLQLQTSDAKLSSVNVWNGTAPDATKVSLGPWNLQGDDYIMYAFKNVDSFSKFGSYTGNGSTNGPIVETGFEPAFLMIKRTDTAGYNWNIWDNKRTPAGERVLYADLTNAEGSYGFINFLSNGFQHTRTNAGFNANGGTYLYIAFAADPDTTAPTLADSFSTVTYTGNGGSSQSITGLGFKPNWLFTKRRDSAGSWVNFDSVRGSDKYNFFNSTGAQGTSTTYLNSFDNDGFTVGSNTAVNTNGASYSAFAFKADDNEPTINTEGSTDSIVSANANAGFSIVKYEGNGTSGATIGHGLSAAPDLMIVKIATGNIGNWAIYHKDLGATKLLQFNTAAAQTNSAWWNNTAPSSSVFSLGTTSDTNASSYGYIAYCFHSVSGYSKISSYTGNGGTLGVTGLGFQPDWVIIKESDGTDSWQVYDSVRGAGKVLYPNGNNAEYAGSELASFDSDGFTVTGNPNENGKTYIYMAFKIN
jgi:hypothetical protein